MRGTYVLLLTSLFIVIGCQRHEDAKPETFSVEAADPRVTHESPLWLSYDKNISMSESAPEGDATVIGFLKAQNAALTSVEGGWHLTTELSLVGADGEAKWNAELSATASSDFNGSWTVNGDDGIRALGTCLHAKPKGGCEEVVIDIILNSGGKRHAVQLIATLAGATFAIEGDEEARQATIEAMAMDPADVEGEDPAEYKSVYVGNLFPPLNDALSKVANQVIGLPNKGSMEKASNLNAIVTAGALPVSFVHPYRKRYYGSFEMMDTLVKLAAVSKAMPRGANLWVGDVSNKNGRRITDSGHKSHQNGLDVDIGYAMTRSQTGGFTDIVTGSGGLIKDHQMSETWGQFKAVWDMGVTDRIFIGATVKRHVCKYAKKQEGEFAKYGQLLRHMRPTPGHDNHYHLRIKCTPNQPRCRMIGPPPAGTGC